MLQVTRVDGLVKALKTIDKIIDTYHFGEIKPDTVLGDIMKERAKQNSMVKKAIELCDKALESYSFNTELLRRRAFLRSIYVTERMEYPEISTAKEDLDLILKIDPNNLIGGLDLLETMFTFSIIEDNEVAEIAGAMAKRAQSILERLGSLEFKAFTYADQTRKAKSSYNRWVKLFPNSKAIRRAVKEIEILGFKK